MRRPARLALVAALALLAPLGVAAAQDATPGAGADRFPVTPDPAACAVEPRAADELLALWYGPDGSPVAGAGAMGGAGGTEVTIPLGPPADAATAEAAAATVEAVFACFAAGDALRAYALFTDELAVAFGPEPGTPREEAAAFLAAPMEMDEGEGVGGEAARAQILAVTDVMELADGRVGAFAVDREGGEASTVYVVFEREGGRLLADELIEFGTLAAGAGGEGTPVP